MARTPASSDPLRPDPAPGDEPRIPTADASAADRPAPGREPAVRQQTATDPALDGHQKQGVSGAAWTALILGLLILILLLVFILQNNVPADFNYLGWQFSLPLGVAMLLAAVAGALIMGLVGSVRLFKLGHRVRKLEKERADIKRALR
ncbi:lipopolysaccharide assembly LapA domain-containing protein [Kocuria sp. CPCC 205263]|uniref:lipopolysaccharide assembly LapA domain-containing protein n=1 Tax=Kocuria sp. CPCC 205263 TaxID=3073555 RepID=UPI0034D54FA3